MLLFAEKDTLDLWVNGQRVPTTVSIVLYVCHVYCDHLELDVFMSLFSLKCQGLTYKQVI